MARTTNATARPMPIGRSYTAAFSPDGTALAVVGQNVTSWDLVARAKRWRTHPVKHPSHCAFSGDGLRLALKTTGGRIVTVDAATGGGNVQLTEADEGEGCGLLYSACSRHLVDGSWAGALTVRDATTGAIEFRRAMDGESVRGLWRSRDGAVWVALHFVRSPVRPASYLTRWSWPFRVPTVHLLSMDVGAAALSNDGRRLAVAHRVDPATDLITVIDLSDDADDQRPPPGTAATPTYVKQMAWSPAGDELAVVVNAAHQFYAWPTLRPTATHPSQYAAEVVYAPDGGRVALCDWSKGIVVTPQWIRTADADAPPRA